MICCLLYTSFTMTEHLQLVIIIQRFTNNNTKNNNYGNTLVYRIMGVSIFQAKRPFLYGVVPYHIYSKQSFLFINSQTKCQTFQLVQQYVTKVI